MKNIIDWLKSNPFTVSMAGVALVGLLAFAYVYVVLAPNSAQAKSDELEAAKQAQDVLLASQVPLPNADPNAPPIMENVIINRQVITTVRNIYETIRQQQSVILDATTAKNSQSHISTLLGGDRFWIEADPERQSARFVLAAEQYLDHFRVPFQHDATARWNMPYFAAGSPPTREEIDELLADTATNFITSMGASAANELTQQQVEQLFSLQREKLMQLLSGRARVLNFYVTLPAEEDRFAPETEGEENNQPDRTTPVGFEDTFGTGGVTSGYGDDVEGYPFRVAPWATANTAPDPDQLWEGQVELWIMRDIMHAIHNVCDLNNGQRFDPANPMPAAVFTGDGLVRNTRDENGQLLNPPAHCVINSPVKRLVALQTMAGYVGLHTPGGVRMESERSARNFDAGFEQTSSTFGSTLGTTDTTQSIYPQPATSLAPLDSAMAIRDHFGITPTGRVSNGVFDVRHTRLVIDIEWQQLPALMEALRQVNFMTVIEVNVEDLDEYELLTGGYVYGPGNIVRADLVIESLWFRNWTEQFMPEVVKDRLLINLPEQDAATDPYGGVPQ